MKIRKRWISLCLTIILLAGIAFNPGSIAGNYVEAANLEETGEAVSEENTQTDNTAAVLSETGASSVQTESTAVTETPAEDTAVTETPVTETPAETPAADTAETPAPAENVETTTDTEQAVTEQPETTVPEETETQVPKETSDSSTEEAVQPSAYEGKYEDDSVIISVSAEPGIVPEGAQLSVTPIEKTEITNDMTAEEAAEAEQINAQYDLTEKKLTEDSEKNEETMEGFLAYDISFIVNGVEVEPSGDVKVTMDFKQAAIPEGVSEDSEVSVKHLKENTAAEDGVVVEDMDAKANVQTTAQAEVQKVELTAESFSTYTITWHKPNSGHRYPIELSAYYGYLDETGRFVELPYGGKRIPYWDEINDKDYTGGNVILENYAESINQNEDTYAFKKAYVAEGREDYNNVNEEDRHKAAAISVNNNAQEKDGYYLFYIDDLKSAKWHTLGEELEGDRTNKFSVYFIYEETEVLTTVKTVDNSQGGITMRMKNYSDPANNIDIGGAYVDGNGYVHQGLLENTLRDGYPVTKNGGSLESLFNGNTVDNLFIKSIYDATGYYEYSSFDNYAYLGNGDEFTVYEQIGTPSDENAIWYKRGNFMPYNKIEAGKFSENKNLYDENGNNLDSSDPSYDEKLYKTQGENDYYFGMSMDVNFSQPEDGLAVHNGASSPMIYEFNGDDDLWVYIDDVLVLDIGGIHDAHSGHINFATGEVHVECVNADKENQNTTIRKMFWEARTFPDGSPWTYENNPKADQFFDGDTFRDYTTHNMKMFYMERGAGASNLHMKFNLQTVPEGTIEVSKELTNTDKEKYANVEFAFQVWAQEVTGKDPQGNEIYSDDKYVLLREATKDGKAVVFHDNEQIGSESYDSVFYLKPGETASFSGLQKDRKYYVKEIGVNPGEYDEVIINGTDIISTSDEGDISKIKDITSSKEEVGYRPHITFQNSCSLANRRELKITKEMAGDQTSNDKFTFQVQLESTEGKLTDYSGPYYLTDSEGNYYYYDRNGNLVSNDKEGVVCGTTTNGQITGVQAGYTVAITTILSGTDFKVWEIDPNSTGTAGKYNPPEYNVEHVDSSDLSDPDSTEFACGEIKLGENAEVTVTNSLVPDEDQPMIRVQKTFSGLTQEAIDALKDKFYITVKDSSKNEVAVLKLKKNASNAVMDGVSVSNPVMSGEELNITYTWEIRNVGAGTYYISEAGTDTPGYELDNTVYNRYPDNQVTTQEPQFSVNYLEEITAPSTSSSKFDAVDLIIISLTSNDKEYLVWSEKPLSAGERESLINADVDVGNGQFENPLRNADMDKIVFYSTRQLIEDGLYYRGEISLNNNKLVFNSSTKQWNQIWLGSYERTGDIDAEIEVVNTYKAATMNVDLKKFKTNFETPLDGAKFSLYTGKMDGAQGKISWDDKPMEGKDSFVVKNEDVDIELKGLQSGYYKLVETEAPQGYIKLAQPIIFKVDTVSKSIQLVDESGYTTLSEMWGLADGNCIEIKNNIEYDLPSSGGSGIYWYTIGGMLLMMAGSLILYKNKRREVLERK